MIISETGIILFFLYSSESIWQGFLEDNKLTNYPILNETSFLIGKISPLSNISCKLCSEFSDSKFYIISYSFWFAWF